MMRAVEPAANHLGPSLTPGLREGDTSMIHIEQEVISIVSQLTKVPPSRLKRDTDLKAELNVDSLQGLQIIAALEQRFGVVLPDEELDNYTSIGVITEVVARQMQRP